MSGSVGRIGLPPGMSVPSTADERAQKLRKAAGDFESLLVKQMLKEAKMGGSQKEGGYADMAVDAMASAVEKGGGLGLARSIERAIGAHGPSPLGSHPSASPLVSHGTAAYGDLQDHPTSAATPPQPLPARRR